MKDHVIYFVHLKGFIPYNTMEKADALQKLKYLHENGFRASITKIQYRKAINLICSRYL